MIRSKFLKYMYFKNSTGTVLWCNGAGLNLDSSTGTLGYRYGMAMGMVPASMVSVPVKIFK